MGVITLDSAACDWVTLTGKDNIAIADYWRDYQETNNDRIKTEQVKWLQWNCEKHSYPDGHILTGMAVIDGWDWMLVRASGERAQDVLMFFYPLVESCVLGCKRIDLQITTEEPKDWEQIRFCNRMHARGKKPDLASSTDAQTGKTLETVALGSRLSETYHRVYEKLTDGGHKLLRYEVEFKGAKAEAVARAMLRTSFAQQIKYQLQSRVKDEQLSGIFANALEGITPHNARPKVNARSKKKQWLLGVVLPSFAEYVNDHSEDGEVAGAFLAVLEEFC